MLAIELERSLTSLVKKKEKYYLLRNMTYSITGTPMTGVTALMGRTEPEGRMLIRLHSRQTELPMSITEGSRKRWSKDLTTKRVMCGTERPMNATGPQKAVAAAVSMPVTRSSRRLTFLVSIPRFWAYPLPSNKPLRRHLTFRCDNY